MSEVQKVTNQALRAAFELRRSLSLTIFAPLHAMEVASQIGLDVRMEDCPSLEGMYLRDARPRIFLPHNGHRPRGRLLFSCAHELGHHQLGHGTSADKYFADDSEVTARSPEEVAADTFASHLLMPRQAVVKSFSRRKLSHKKPSPLDCFLVSQELGVGYATLITQMSAGLKILPFSTAANLKKAKPIDIRESIWKDSRSTNLFVLDEQWIAPTCNVTTGDFIVLPKGLDNAGPCVRHIAACPANTNTDVYEVVMKGTQTLATSGSSSVSLRVTNQEYMGTYPNSFLPEPSDE